MDMRRALKDRLANYKIPQDLKVLKDGLPRNAMGKSKSPQLRTPYIGVLTMSAQSTRSPWLRKSLEIHRSHEMRLL